MFPTIAIVSLLISLTPSGPVSFTELSQYLKVIASNGGFPGQIACRDVNISMRLKKHGISVDFRSSVAWASTIDQVCKFRDERKFVICSDPEFLEFGACMAIIREHGKPVLMLNRKNYKASGYLLPDIILKEAKTS